MGRGGQRLTLLLLCAFNLQAASAAGPTLRLDEGHGESIANPMSDFMYFIPLISPSPVSVGASPGGSQSARLVSVTRHSTGSSFLTACEFEFAGSGLQESIFDLSREIRRHEQEIKAGGSLNHQLESIIVDGPGAISVEVQGAVTNGVRAVTEVTVRFNARAQASPVSIRLCDVRWANGRFYPANELLARVSALTFRRAPGAPKMEITLASVKDADAGDGLWQNLKGSIKGKAANFFLPPLRVESVGNTAMLDFGLALDAGSPAFTFPEAKNLVHGGIPQSPFWQSAGQ